MGEKGRGEGMKTFEHGGKEFRVYEMDKAWRVDMASRSSRCLAADCPMGTCGKCAYSMRNADVFAALRKVEKKGDNR